MKNFLEINRTPSGVKKIFNFNFKSLVQSPARWLLTLVAILTLGVGQMWASSDSGTAYNKRYLYVNSSNCSWWTDASSQPALNAYWNDELNNDAAFRAEADGELTTTSWYFDLSTMNASYLYFRGFKVQRHPKSSSSWWNQVGLAVGSGTHNCLWINNDGGGMSWGYYAVPISSITLSATSGYLSGSGISGDPYLVPVGTSISLSASPSCTPADGTMSFCANFGTSPASSPTTVTSTGSYSVASTSKVGVKCKGRNKYGDVYSADVTSNSIYVQGVVPSVGVSAAGSVTTTTATLNATVTVNGATTTAYGFKYGTTNNVETLKSGTDASTSGALALNATSFSKDITSLSPSTTYYYISYVTTASGTYYSASTQSFTTATPAEETHDVSVTYKYGATTIKTGVTESAVGVSTARSVTAPSITGYTFSSWTLGDGLTNKSASTSANPISIVTKSTGSYTLQANYNINSHTVTFNAMSGSGSMSAESFNYNETKALTTNAYTRSGYVFKGWATSSDNATAGTVAYANGANYTMGDANVTLYAVWYKKAYFVNVPKWTAANVKAHVYKGDDAYKTWNASAEVMTSTGTTVFGYTIFSYEFPDKYTTVKFHNNGANETDAWTWSSSTPYYYHGASTQYASVDAIRQAWKVYGSWNQTAGVWNSNNFTSYSTGTATYTVSLDASTTYNFKYVFAGTNTWYGSNGGSMSDGDTWTLNGSSDVSFTTTVAGTYTFTIDYSGMSSNSAPSCTVDFPVSYTLTYSIGSVAGNNGSISTSPSTSSGSKVLSGNTVTLTGPAAKTGYTWKGWYTNPGGTTGHIDDTNRAITITMDGDKTLYACYTEDDYTVSVIAGEGGSVASDNVTAHKDTKVTLPTATNSSGYYFTGWEVIEGTASLSSSSSANAAKINGVTSDNTVTVRANFHPDDKIYFDNTYTQWDNVWVYLFNNNCWYENKSGDYGPGVAPTINRVAYAQMTKVAGEENLYEYAYHTSSRNYTFSHVAFCKVDQHDNGAFYQTEAVYRGDWNAYMPIYVAPSSFTTTNDTKYHSEGYWMMKETTAGESIKYSLRHKTGNNTSEEIGAFKATADGSHVASITLRYDETSNKTYFINNIASQNYSVDHTFTSADNGKAYDLYKYNDIIEFTVTPTSAGLYTFFLEQGTEHMHISIQYPVQIGDRRLVYSYTSGGTKYRYSDIMRAAETSAIASMYIDKDQSGAALKLERCTGFDNSGNPQWGSAKTGLISNFAGKEKGVYVMTVNFAGTNDANTTLSNIALYSGNYYLKSDCAPGGWANYKQNVMNKNTNNPSATFNFSYCKWIGNTNTNVRCVIANDYNNAISDTLKSDDILVHGTGIQYETLPERGNVRFSYNSTTNEVKRTYLRGSTLSEDFVTLVPNASGYVYSAQSDGTDYYSSHPKFSDNGNWTYQMDAWIYPTAKAGVQTQYPGWAPITTQTLVPLNNELMGGAAKGTVRYHVRLVYDFKTDYLMSAWMPSGTVTQNIDLKSDFLIIRNGQNTADQLSFNTGKKVTDAQHAYAAFQFNKNDMVGQMGSWNDAAYQQCVYYFSFPFDVKVSDIFGIGKMGVDWRIRKYNGAKRASEGWFAETATFWEDVTASETLNKYEGYCLLLNRVKFNTDGGEDNVWDNISSGGSVYLYFPSSTLIGTISDKEKTITVPSHLCEIDRVFTQDLGKDESEQRNHIYADSHWNMIGVPILSDTAMNLTTLGFTTTIDPTDHFKYFYEWIPTGASRNTLRITAAANFTFKSLYAYMAQYSGDIEFKGAVITPPSSVAARRKAETKNYTVELGLLKDDESIGRAYVELRENASDGFQLDEDVYMMSDSKIANLYTYAGAYDVAANVMSVGNHTIPVGVNVKTAGTYVFTMPSDFSGTVTLVDTFSQARTNLSLGDYEVALEKGEINDRFYLELNVQQVVSSLENTNGSNALNDGEAHKFLQNGVMYILQNGVIYDARGNRVK